MDPAQFGYINQRINSDVVDPVIIDSPSNFTVDETYTGQSISWTATDANAGNYTITRDVTTVVTTTNWTSGTPVVYNIPDGLLVGTYTFTIDFQDTSLASNTSSVVMTIIVPDTTFPVITSAPSDIVIEAGEIPQNFLWTATDANPGTYTVTINGTIEGTATNWISGTAVNFTVPWAYCFVVGTTTFEITFFDMGGNNVTDSVTMTVKPVPPEKTPSRDIPGFEPLIVIGIFAIGTIGLMMLKKKRK